MTAQGTRHNARSIRQESLRQESLRQESLRQESTPQESLRPGQLRTQPAPGITAPSMPASTKERGSAPRPSAPRPSTSGPPAPGSPPPGSPAPGSPASGEPPGAAQIDLLPWHFGALAIYHWPAPPTTRARGVVLLVHGLGEHMGRYAHVAAQLQRAGWICVGYDHPGHGRSEGIRGRLPHSQALEQALIHVALHVVAELPTRVAQELPFVLVGHSMGGLVVAESLRSSADRLPDIAAVVLSAPAFGAPLAAWQRLALRTLAGPLPHLSLDHAIQPQWICRDTAVVRNYQRDPLVHRRVTPRLGGWIVSSGERVVAEAGKWRHRALLLSAGVERLVSNKAIDAFISSAPPGIVEHHHEPAMFHEMFNDADHVRVLQVVLRWLEEHAPPGTLP